MDKVLGGKVFVDSKDTGKSTKDVIAAGLSLCPRTASTTVCLEFVTLLRTPQAFVNSSLGKLLLNRKEEDRSEPCRDNFLQTRSQALIRRRPSENQQKIVIVSISVV